MVFQNDPLLNVIFSIGPWSVQIIYAQLGEGKSDLDSLASQRRSARLISDFQVVRTGKV